MFHLSDSLCSKYETNILCNILDFKIPLHVQYYKFTRAYSRGYSFDVEHLLE